MYHILYNCYNRRGTVYAIIASIKCNSFYGEFLLLAFYEYMTEYIPYCSISISHTTCKYRGTHNKS